MNAPGSKNGWPLVDAPSNVGHRFSCTKSVTRYMLVVSKLRLLEDGRRAGL
jgi:hypothetical protein